MCLVGIHSTMMAGLRPIIISLLLVCAYYSTALSQQNCIREHKNNYGKRFFLSEMRYTANFGKSGDTPTPFYLRIACNENGFVYITAPGFGLNRQAHRISPRLTTIAVRPTSNFINTTKSQTGILLETSVDSAIFVLDKTNTTLYAVDGMMLIPEDALGHSYVIPSFWKGMGYPRFKVIGTQSRTSVNVTFMSNMTNEFYGNGVSPRFYKYMHESYIVNYLEVLNFHPYGGDPSGTIIESDEPVAVVYEDPSAIITPNLTSSGTFDKTSSKLIPVTKWGMEYVVPPVYPRNKYLVRVFAYYNDTIVTAFSSTKTWSAMLNRGEFEELILPGTGPLMIRGNKPISVYQFSFSQDNYYEGHSSMILVPSLENFAKGPYTFATMVSLDFSHIFTDYASIIIEKQFKDQLMYNGSALQPLTTYSVRNLDNYVVVIVRLDSTETVHTITNSDASARFGLLVYGISYTNQFGYVGGMSFNETACGQSTTTTPASFVTMTSRPISANDKGPRCYSCSHIPHLRYCDTLKQCQDGQVCFVERHKSGSGMSYYSAGCTQEQSCQVNHLSPSTTSDHCYSCCGSNFCNNAGCGDQGPSSSPGISGPLCFDCQNFDDPAMCDRVTLCGADEVCSIEEYRWGSTEKIYKMGCAQKPTCASISDHFRRSVPVCHSCCAKDYCNVNCTSSLNPGDIVG